MSILCNTLAPFDDDHMIPTYGFGDTRTRDTGVFSFEFQDRPTHTLEGVVERYRSMADAVRMSGPTSFAPAIYKAMKIVSESGGRYHILVIICDGSVRFLSFLHQFLSISSETRGIFNSGFAINSTK